MRLHSLLRALQEIASVALSNLAKTVSCLYEHRKLRCETPVLYSPLNLLESAEADRRCYEDPAIV